MYIWLISYCKGVSLAKNSTDDGVFILDTYKIMNNISKQEKLRSPSNSYSVMSFSFKLSLAKARNII